MQKILLCIGVKCNNNGEFDKVINVDSIFDIDALSKSKKELLSVVSNLLNLKKRLEKGEDVGDAIMNMSIIPNELKELIANADKIGEIHIRTSKGIRSFAKSILSAALKDVNVVFEDE